MFQVLRALWVLVHTLLLAKLLGIQLDQQLLYHFLWLVLHLF